MSRLRSIHNWTEYLNWVLEVICSIQKFTTGTLQCICQFKSSQRALYGVLYLSATKSDLIFWFTKVHFKCWISRCFCPAGNWVTPASRSPAITSSWLGHINMLLLLGGWSSAHRAGWTVRDGSAVLILTLLFCSCLWPARPARKHNKTMLVYNKTMLVYAVYYYCCC